MTEQMQRDIEIITDLLSRRTRGSLVFSREAEAWQRIKASLSPDREGLAEAMYEAQRGEDSHWRELTPVQRVWWLAAADAAIQAMQGVSNWQSIETAPKDGTRVLIWDKHECSENAASWQEVRTWGGKLRGEWQTDFVCADHGPHVIDYPSHWMPLPAPPEVKP